MEEQTVTVNGNTYKPGDFIKDEDLDALYDEYENFEEHVVGVFSDRPDQQSGMMFDPNPDLRKVSDAS